MYHDAMEFITHDWKCQELRPLWSLIRSVITNEKSYSGVFVTSKSVPKESLFISDLICDDIKAQHESTGNER